MRIVPPITAALVVVSAVSLVGCSSTSTAGAGAGAAGAASTAASVASAVSAAASTAGTAGSAGGSGGGATFSGDFSGTMSARLCTGGIASLKVVVKGDSSTYNGSVSATSIGFVGPEAADYTLAAGNAKPVVSSDGNSFTVTGEKLIDLVSKKSVTLTGTVTCP